MLHASFYRKNFEFKIGRQKSKLLQLRIYHPDVRCSKVVSREGFCVGFCKMVDFGELVTDNCFVNEPKHKILVTVISIVLRFSRKIGF